MEWYWGSWNNNDGIQLLEIDEKNKEKHVFSTLQYQKALTNYYLGNHQTALDDLLVAEKNYPMEPMFLELKAKIFKKLK